MFRNLEMEECSICQTRHWRPNGLEDMGKRSTETARYESISGTGFRMAFPFRAVLWGLRYRKMERRITL